MGFTRRHSTAAAHRSWPLPIAPGRCPSLLAAAHRSWQMPIAPGRIPARGAQTTYIESPRLYLRISACRPQTVYVQSPRLYRIYQTACLRVDLKSLVSHLLAYTSDIRQHYCAWTSNISYRIFQTLPQISVSISARGPQTIHVECPKLYFGYARACLRVDLKQCM